MNRLTVGRGTVSLRIVYAVLICALACLLGSPKALADGSADWVKSRSQTRSALLDTTESGTSLPEEVRVRALLALADQAINRSVEEAMQHLERAEKLISNGSDAQIVALAIRCQLEHRQSLPAADTHCGRLNRIELSTEGSFVAAFAHVTRMYYFYREGQHERSVLEAERALEIATPINDPGLLASAHNMLGLHFSTRLRPRMSLPHFESALEYASHLPYTEPLTITQLNLASSYTYLGRAREALQMLNEARESHVVDLYATRRLVVQSMIGQAQAAIGETETAEQELQRVIDDVGHTVLPDAMTFGFTGLGVIQLAKNQPTAALESFAKVMEITGKSFENDLDYPRIQLIAVPYASALRESGQPEKSIQLLREVISNAKDEPDQILADAYQELALTLEATGDKSGAQEAVKNHARIESSLWDASLQYQVARLNASVESQRSKLELQQARERETALRAAADKESRLKRQSWLIAVMIVVVAILLFSRRLQKRIADAERAANASLEHQVKERTRELENEMHKRTAAEVERRKLAEKIHEGEKLRAMGKITAGVAHDFNNLMTVVTLGADDLKSHLGTDENSRAADTLKQIHRAADTGAKITRGLLAYVREQPLQSHSVQLDEVLIGALPMFRNTLGERFSLDLSAEKCHVLVDKGQLITAVLNLLLNAKEAMSDGGQVSVELTNVDGQAKIRVSDRGRGMDETVLKHAVDPFFTTKDNEEGSGLGLSMVYGFARQSNGDLDLESTPGEGTTITLSLPLVRTTSVQRPSAQSSAHQIPKGTRMLAVEDRKQILQVLARTLTKLGADVSTASNADEALEVVARTGLPDILITDIVMPGDLDGLELVARLRDQDPDLPVVLMSGYSREVDSECTFLHKPFSSAELKGAITKTLKERKRSASFA